jgi:L-Ala-D/L-Glu epimerase
MERLCIPFRTTFRHASAARSETQSLWVEAHANDGTIGYGESCPREYVTGESLQSAARFFRAHQTELQKQAKDFASLHAWSKTHASVIDSDPAAWCAIELALLDLFAKQTGQSVEQCLSLPAAAGKFRYTAVLGDAELPAFQQQLGKYQAAGFDDFKVKLSGRLEHDRSKLAMAAAATPHQVRLDANNLWGDVDAAVTYLSALNFGFFAIEEPLKPYDYEGMAKLAKALKVKVILDESFTHEQQIGALPSTPGPWIINIRVSKLGGLLRSINAIEQARARGIPVIVGTQVGETKFADTRRTRCCNLRCRSRDRARRGFRHIAAFRRCMYSASDVRPGRSTNRAAAVFGIWPYDCPTPSIP